MASLDYGIIKSVHEALLAKGVRISLAESCTAGLVGHALTLMPGARGSFDSSVVCYSRHAKQKLLGLSEEFLDEHGTVSDATARAMAEAVRKKTETDVGMAITGILGPETIEDREIGVVYIAISTVKETISRRCRLKGERDDIKHDAVNMALQFLYDSVLQVQNSGGS